MMKRVGLLLMALCVWHCEAQEKGLVFAHRGGAHEFEENTLAAFQASYAKGLRGFETDVRMTKDGVLVILHDDTMDRTYKGSGSVEHKTADELRQIRSRKGDQPFLFLSELLEFFRDKPGIYLELEMKTGNRQLYPDSMLETYCRKLYDQALAARLPEVILVFTSFDERPLRTMKQIDQEVDIMLITGGVCTQEFIDKALSLGSKRVGCNINPLSRNHIRAAQKAGLKVTVWPGHSIADYELGRALDADAICSDIPVQVLEYLKTRRP